MIPDCHPTKARGPPGLLTAIRTAIHRQPFTDHYTVIPGSELGRGKFAVVRKCVEKCSGLQFAAKFMRKRRKGQDCRTEIIHEIAVLELATPCPLVVDLHQVYESTSEMVLVLEWSEEIESSMEARYCAAGGEIFNRCVSEDEAFSEDDVKRLMRQILEGVSFLHQHNVVHLDLKPQNILLTSSSPLGDIRIVDFGLSRVVSNNQELREIMGTPEYVAPEILNYEPISTATDMWSVGVLAYVMLTGVSPFLGEDKQETFLNICQIDDSFSDEEVLLQEEALSFIQTLLRKHQPERASAQQCLQHSWLRTSQLQKQLQEQLHPAEVLESPKTIIEPPKCISTPEEEEEEEEEKGLVREELMVMAAYTLGQCRQSTSSSEQTVMMSSDVNKHFKFEEPFSSLKEVIGEFIY